MDMKIVGHCDKRLLSSRTIWCQLLPLIVFWHFFDGAGSESSWAWRINDPSAYVSMVEISKNVMVFDYEEQESLMLRVFNDINDFRLRNVRLSFSFFSWPVCPYRWGADVFYAFGHDT